MKFGIEKKMVLGYLPLMLTILSIAFLSAYSLNDVNTINRSIVEEDTFLIQAANDMEDAILAQESYGRRYLILDSRRMLDLFGQRSREFKDLIARVRALPDQEGLPIEQLASLHNTFTSLYTDADSKSPQQFTQEFDEQARETFAGITTILHGIIRIGEQNKYLKLQKANRIGIQTFRLTALLSTLGIILGLAAASLLTRNIFRSISGLKRATELISEGKYDDFPLIDTKDELEDLSRSICSMAMRLSQLEKIHLDSSPLTRMPGGAAIENALIKRLESDTELTFCMLDLDNFKSYNDRYGYARGNKVIRATAMIIRAAVTEYGASEDFAGHIGGDDFAIITSIEKYEMICNSIIRRFDENIVNFYSKIDRKRGSIVSRDRQGRRTSFPIMSISIAVVTNGAGKQMNHLEIGEVSAELKKYAKSIPGSVVVTNRRGEKTVQPYAGNTAIRLIK